MTGKLKTEPGSKDDPDSGYRSRFRHEAETAKPGYYSVHMDDYGISAELTVTRRAGFHRYIFSKSDSARILIDLVHGIQDQTTDAGISIIDDRAIAGYRCSTGWAKEHCVYFYAELSKPFSSSGIVEGDVITMGKRNGEGRNIKAFAEYEVRSGDEIMVKVGISHTSLEGAKKNVKSEIPDWDFDGIRTLAEEAWEQELRSVIIDDPSVRNKTVFYTALYRSFLAPNTLSDVDGSYVGMDREIHSVTTGNTMYTVFSLWDTFRALHPLFTIVQQKRTNEMIRALISKYEEHGLLPVWELASNETETMIGYHSIPVIADAFVKGLKDYDVETAYAAMKKSAIQKHHGLEFYKDMGFISADLDHESVSKTLEYAYDDWCIAIMAKRLGYEEDYRYYLERAKFYVNLFDPTTLFMRAKENGRWVEPFDPYSVSGHYTEANAWQYSFFVPQDVGGLIARMGGDVAFIGRLDKLFTAETELTGWFQPDITGLIGQYAHGNEPSHHIAYLYNFAGAPWKTQERVHEILTTQYSELPDGLAGNEDCGQMSAWYVLSSLGFYPVTPGSDIYVIGTPHFNRATINVEGGSEFTILARNKSEKNFYIQSATLNGKPYRYAYIRHADIVEGGELIFEMGSRPGTWGSELGARPVSSIDIPFVPVPYLSSGERVFRDSVVVTLAAIDSESDIVYTLDETDPIDKGRSYDSPIVLIDSGVLKAAGRSGGTYSKVVTARFNKIPEGRTISLASRYHNNYTGGGENALIDGIKGSLNFRTGWQGFEEVDFEAVVDLGSVQNVSFIGTSFLQNTYSWIFYPIHIVYSVSQDGVRFQDVYEAENSPVEENKGEGIKDFTHHLDTVQARYVKVYAQSVGVCPDWHHAAGGKAWVFIDEITIK